MTVLYYDKTTDTAYFTENSKELKVVQFLKRASASEGLKVQGLVFKQDEKEK